jgi:hypothetical protein
MFVCVFLQITLNEKLDRTPRFSTQQYRTNKVSQYVAMNICIQKEQTNMSMAK